ncbi:MAG: methyltransferase domain-containing protein, partial [Candidatus Omnitrophica bacterium]|nr:methyltransferase domain-containing protein [Candidatus Omnitrophota bacterium]
MKQEIREDKYCKEKGFKEGDLVIFYDPLNNKSYIQRLHRDGKFMTHRGIIEHRQALDKEEGEVVLTHTEREFFVFRPTLNEFIKKMARKSAIMHPKDLGIVLLWADIYPGLKIVEAGSGSGALLLALLRLVGEKGEVISYDVREDLQEIAKENIKNFLGEVPNLKFKIKDIYTGIEEVDVDRIILDLPCPWEALNTLKTSLRSGGIVLAYLPTITQSEKFVKSLQQAGDFSLIE